MLSDTSLICQFNFDNYNGLTNYLVESTEKLFAFFNYKIKKIYTSSDEKVWSPGYRKFKSFINPDYFSTLSFQSDYNREDFEPQTRFYVNINNSLTKGSPYMFPIPIVKFIIVVNDVELLNNVENIYKDILSVLSEIPQVNVVGYSFLLPNTYGAVSFSAGILRKPNMSQSLQNLARWYSDSKVSLGYLIVLRLYQKRDILLLKGAFGKQNVETINGITFFRNELVNSFDIENYFISADYKKLCDKLDLEL